MTDNYPKQCQETTRCGFAKTSALLIFLRFFTTFSNFLFTGQKYELVFPGRKLFTKGSDISMDLPIENMLNCGNIMINKAARVEIDMETNSTDNGFFGIHYRTNWKKET